jgi:type VI secretion system protein ImpM
MSDREPTTQVAESGEAVAGWFGKIPALGDFASRRMPESFVAPWDAWLSQGLECARGALGDGWLDAYLSAPLWRFGLMPGIVDRHGWVGVLMPSVDRVGRYFPLTIAAAWSDPAPALAGVEEWLAGLRAIALDCLAPTGGVETLEAALSQLSMPWAGVDTDAEPATIPGWAEIPSRLPGDSGLQAALCAAAVPLMRNALAQKSLWWPWQADDRGASITVCSGLPGPDAFVGLLDGSL